MRSALRDWHAPILWLWKLDKAFYSPFQPGTTLTPNVSSKKWWILVCVGVVSGIPQIQYTLMTDWTSTIKANGTRCTTTYKRLAINNVFRRIREKLEGESLHIMTRIPTQLLLIIRKHVFNYNAAVVAVRINRTVISNHKYSKRTRLYSGWYQCIFVSREQFSRPLDNTMMSSTETQLKELTETE